MLDWKIDMHGDVIKRSINQCGCFVKFVRIVTGVKYGLTKTK